MSVYNLSLIFFFILRLPKMNAQVIFFYHNLSVICQFACKLFLFSISPNFGYNLVTHEIMSPRTTKFLTIHKHCPPPTQIRMITEYVENFIQTMID